MDREEEFNMSEQKMSSKDQMKILIPILRRSMLDVGSVVLVVFILAYEAWFALWFISSVKGSALGLVFPAPWKVFWPHFDFAILFVLATLLSGLFLYMYRGARHPMYAGPKTDSKPR